MHFDNICDYHSHSTYCILLYVSIIIIILGVLWTPCDHGPLESFKQ